MRYPWLFLLVAALSLVPALYGIFGNGGLGFRPNFSELLPDNKDSVIEARRVAKRMAGVSTLTIVAQITDGHHPDALKDFVQALVPALNKLGPEKIGSIDYNITETKQFFERNKVMYANINDVRELHDEVLDRYDYEIAKARGDYVDEEDAPTPLSADEIEKRIRAKAGNAMQSVDRFPDGYYMDKEGTIIALFIRTPITEDNEKDVFRKEVERIVADVNPQSFNPSMQVNYTGNFVTSAEEYNTIVSDLKHVGGWGITGIFAAVFLFFLRFRALGCMIATVGIALSWTFGLTRITIGYLNSSTGFLVSIIAGNGINYSIMYMARYIEARRDEHMNVNDAILVAHRDSWIPTLAGSATAMLAYGSLMLTDFRGFKHFGIISGYGMILCWVATYLFLPAMLAATEAILPSFRKTEKRSVFRGYYGVPFAKIACHWPRATAIVGAMLGVVALVSSVMYLSQDPIEYDMKNVRNKRMSPTAAGALSERVDKIMGGRLTQDGMAIVADRIDQVPDLVAALNKRYDEAPADKKPFERVVSIFSVLPKDQFEKSKLINEIRDRLLRAREKGFISDKDWHKIEPYVPDKPVEPILMYDLPEQVARAFTERDGRRGLIVYLAPKEGFSVWNARYLMRWADSYRYTKLPSGEVIKGSGNAVVFADMLETIGEDAPKAITLSALGSIIVILIAFRLRRQAWGVFLPWLGGIAGLLAFLQIANIKLNFLNFVTLPITIGIGAEYAHNLMQRYRIEKPEHLYKVIVETGGAVMVCAATTILGYLALTLSINKGIASFGLSAAVGEVTCIFAALLFLPAFLFWMTRRKGITCPCSEKLLHSQTNDTNTSEVPAKPPAEPHTP